jgi:hypothetical protein
LCPFCPSRDKKVTKKLLKNKNSMKNEKKPMLPSPCKSKN